MKKRLVVFFSLISILLFSSVLFGCSIDTASPATLVLTVETAVEASDLQVAVSSGKVKAAGKKFTFEFDNRNNHTITVWAKDYLTQTIIVTATDFKTSDKIEKTIKLEHKIDNIIQLSVDTNGAFTAEKVNDFNGIITQKGSRVTIAVPKDDKTEQYKLRLVSNDMETREIDIDRSSIIGGYYVSSVKLTEKDTRLVEINNMERPDYFLTENMSVLTPITIIKPNGDHDYENFFLKVPSNDIVVVYDRYAHNNNKYIKIDGSEVSAYDTAYDFMSEETDGEKIPKPDKRLYISDGYIHGSAYIEKDGKYYPQGARSEYDENLGNYRTYVPIFDDCKLMQINSVYVGNDDSGYAVYENHVHEYYFSSQAIADSNLNPIINVEVSLSNNNISIFPNWTKTFIADEEEIYYDISQKTSDGKYAVISQPTNDDYYRLDSKIEKFDGEKIITEYRYSPKMTLKFKFDKGAYDISKISINNNAYSDVGDGEGNVTLTNVQFSESDVYKVEIGYNEGEGENKYLFEEDFTKQGNVITANKVLSFGGYVNVLTNMLSGCNFSEYGPSGSDIYTEELFFNGLTSADSEKIIKLSWGSYLISIDVKFKIKINLRYQGFTRGTAVLESEEMTAEEFISLKYENDGSGNSGKPPIKFDKIFENIFEDKY